MGALMNDALGIGLAATQVGVLHRVLVYRVEHDSPVNALVNPVLEWSGERQGDDGGGLPEPARRPRRRRAPDPRPRPRAGRRPASRSSIEATGLEARVIQHEMDHLDGVLILDRTLARPAQGGHADPPRAPRGGLSDRLPRHVGLRGRRPRAPRRPPTTARRSSSPGPTAPPGRGRRLTPPPVADAARALGLELVQPESVNTRRGGRARRRRRAPTSSSCAPSARSSRSRC